MTDSNKKQTHLQIRICADLKEEFRQHCYRKYGGNVSQVLTMLIKKDLKK